jgi:hypothetical protein
LRYAQENPQEIVETIEDLSERRIAEMMNRERAMSHAARKRRYTAAELAEVPF